MAINRSVDRAAVSVAEAHLARVAADGSSRHRHLNALLEASSLNPARDLADAVHLLCGLHGNQPSLVEHAYQNAPKGPSSDWLARAAEAFERERLFLVRLTSAVGPLPSTPGAAETEATMNAQRNALEILATSERRGCALGAAAALVGDWWPIRRILDRAASRAGIDSPAPALPDEASIVAVIEGASDTPASERALGFGGEQLLLQHRGLFDLLEARSEARKDY
ncbi:DUF6975 family protein [Sphingomonas daechungensis]|uniref:DUF6975 family protein n=1 Tax=Sphingomonas daechungensis TaxID=1176646 RepID=UPI00378459B4